VPCSGRPPVMPERYAAADCEQPLWPCANRRCASRCVSQVGLQAVQSASNVSLDLQSLHRSLDGSPGPRQPPFGVGCARSTGVGISRTFRRGGIRFLGLPVPPEEFGCPCGWRSWLLPDEKGITMFRTSETRLGWVSSILRGQVVSTSAAASVCTACRCGSAVVFDPIVLPSWSALHSATCANGASTRIDLYSPVQSFPCPVWPGGSAWP
jgi:hypothetical protein